MNTSKKLSGFALASAAALMLTACGGEGDTSSTAEAGSATEASVHCSGINACKGQSACATANSGCKGQNACKGQGWVDKTQAECDSEGGTVAG
jgi:pectate lyase